jgi:hypothetical protein
VEEGTAPAFVRKISEAALIACSPDYELLRPVLLELRRRNPAMKLWKAVMRSVSDTLA